MRVDLTVVLFEVLNFAVLVWLLKRFLFVPVRRTLLARRVEIERVRNEAAEQQR